jgi:hypothetical protein
VTVTQLIKKLEDIRKSGGGRNQVVVDKPSFWDGNGTFNQCDIHDVSCEVISIVDGDGFAIINKDGSERCRTSVVLKGKN